MPHVSSSRQVCHILNVLTSSLVYSILILSRPWYEETDISFESLLLDYSTGDRRGCQWLHPYRRHLQTWNPSWVCNRWMQSGPVLKSQFKRFCNWMFWHSLTTVTYQHWVRLIFGLGSKCLHNCISYIINNSLYTVWHAHIRFWTWKLKQGTQLHITQSSEHLRFEG